MMADNVHRKSHKLLDNKKSSVIPIHRTTTETIRLGELEKFQQTASVSSSNNAANNNQCRKKTSSFQITSVTVGCRMSNDAGEDSNDDLDESHTEDNSVDHSRVTDIDIETPSYSEDTFSKEDVFFNTSNAALSTAPVIPTSSQYGLAIVPSEGNSVNHSVNDNNINTLNISSVTDNNIINLLSSNTKQDPDIREVHSPGRNERFKVVKIESTEPFKRGRWTCMDYLDHTSVNQSAAITTLKVSSDPNEVCISYGITDSGAVIPDALKQTAASMDDKGADACQIQPQHQDVHSSVSMTSNSTISNASYTVNGSIGQNVQHNPANQVQNQTQVPPQQMSQYFQPSPQQLQQQQGGHGSTLQPNHHNNLGQSQSMSQGSISVAAQPNNKSVAPQPNINHPKEDPYATVTPPSQPLASQNVCPSTPQSSVPRPTVSPPANATANILVSNVPQHQPQQPHSQQQSQHHHSQTQTQLPQQQSQSQVAETITGITGIQSISNIHKVPQSTSQQPPLNMHGSVSPMTQSQMQAPVGNSNSQVQMTSASCQSIGSAIQSGNVTFHHAEQEDSNSTLVVSSASQSADATLIESLAEVTQSNDDHHILEDNESMSGTSAVAIDNKIEQAMDLVKSHLMFAVREEVEVLKEKIAELMDRINQLEAENSILKSHATPDILAQLSSSQSTTKMPQSNNSGNGQ